jgi:hypothetical protein
MNLNIDPKKNPNIIGELLRDTFFKEEYETCGNQKYRKVGCYSIFELAEDVVELPEEPIDEEYPEDGNYRVAKKIVDGQEIIMKYYWDGDGQLEFHFPDGSILANDDCKKDYTWEYFNGKLPETW